jgi:Zn-dependent metalloprotease
MERNNAMRTLHQSLCHVIPPHILRHIAESRQRVDVLTRESACDTIAQMAALSRQHEEELDVEDAISTNGGKQRNVYDAGHLQRLPGKPVRSEHTIPTRDVEVNEAFDGAGKTYDFFAAVYNRDSVDGKGLPLIATVHYGRRFENAFWNGGQMVYGDGDGKLFNRFTAALDVIGHELTHGVTQYTANLGYTGQTGALNEHISDTFGILVKQSLLGQTAAQSDWIIGEGLFGPTVQGKGLRSMAAPGNAYDDPVLGRDPQPAHMRDYVVTTADNGGVHINSGIPNHAFYLAAVTIGGPSWDVLGRVWYASLFGLKPNADFQAFADATVDKAAKLYGPNGPVVRAVNKAWLQVGLKPAGSAVPEAAKSRARARKRGRRRPVKRLTTNANGRLARQKGTSS